MFPLAVYTFFFSSVMFSHLDATCSSVRIGALMWYEDEVSCDFRVRDLLVAQHRSKTAALSSSHARTNGPGFPSLYARPTENHL